MKKENIYKEAKREERIFQKSRELGIGESFTYSNLCRYLEEPIKNGTNSKERQFKFWSRYFNFEKINRKLVITEIYDEPLEKETYLPANTIYVEYIEYVLLFFLYHQDSKITYITRRQLYLVLGLINDNYVTTERDKELLLKEIQELYKNESKKAIKFYISDFYNKCSRKFTSIVDASLKSLQRRRYIEYSTSYHLYFIDYDEFGKSYLYDRYATDPEIGRIVNIERYALDQLGRYTEADIYLHNEDKEYYNIVLEEAQKVYPGLKYMYKCIKFIYNENHIKKELTDETAERKKLELNEISVNTINELIKNSYEKFLTETNKTEFHYSKMHLKIQYYLCNKLIKITDGKNIREKEGE